MLSEKIKQISDSISFSVPSYIKNSTTLALVLTDNCSPKSDTVLYKIQIKQTSPKTTFNFNDSQVCDNSDLKLMAHFENDDSSKFEWTWKYIYNNKSWFPLKNGKNSNADSLIYQANFTVNDPITIALILNDKCTEKTDTAFVKISLRKPVIFTSKFNDTTLCYGNVLKLKAIATGGKGKNYNFEWKNINDNAVLSNSDTFDFFAVKTSKI
ncbi:MAG: hypothetical protein HUU47_11285, partial [Bacteroidetes bacterium]|nr:hypothetical protein [Bacteroidota bacterium]